MHSLERICVSLIRRYRMKWFLFTLVLAQIICSRAHFGFQRSKLSSRTRDRGRCPQRLPRPMSLDRFRREVVGKRWTEVVFKVSVPIDIEADVFYHFNQIINATDEESVFKTHFLARMFGDTSSGDCSAGGVNVFTAKSQDLAVFTPSISFLPTTAPMELSYFSSDPTNHLFEVACNVTEGSSYERQCCTGAWFVVLFNTADPPHFFNWKAAMRDLWKQMRLSLSDNFYMIFQYLACDNAAP